MFDPFLSLPHTVNNYILNSVIGRGGFAVVYKATHIKYSMDFAIKVMKQCHHAHNNISSFEAEVKSLTKIDHPNVIRLYDYLKDKDNLFLVLEYCSGGTLEDMIARNDEICYSEKIKICSQIISALKYCNEMSIAHYDIKTSNILFDSNGRVKVADFGLSGLIGREKHLKEFKGTLRYLAPEICRRVSFDPFKSDIWSLGVLFYRLFTYQYPFRGRNDKEIRQHIIDGIYPEILVGQIGDIVRKMLNSVPCDRISIEKLADLKIFSQIDTIHSFHHSRIPLNQNNFQRKLSKKRFSTVSSQVFSISNNRSKDQHPQLAKCVNVHMSQTFLTSPISQGSVAGMLIGDLE